MKFNKLLSLAKRFEQNSNLRSYANKDLSEAGQFVLRLIDKFQKVKNKILSILQQSLSNDNYQKYSNIFDNVLSTTNYQEIYSILHNNHPILLYSTLPILMYIFGRNELINNIIELFLSLKNTNISEEYLLVELDELELKGIISSQQPSPEWISYYHTNLDELDF